jgi:predicted MFS family arabinose efflux permease
MNRNYLQITNLILGISILILFAITGQLMRHYYFNVDAPDVERLYRRSRHLFLLMAGLTHGGIGVYIVAHQNKWANLMQWLATALMLMATILLVFAFFYEIPTFIVRTPNAKMGVYLLLAGVSIHFISSLLNGYLGNNSSLKK